MCKGGGCESGIAHIVMYTNQGSLKHLTSHTNYLEMYGKWAYVYEISEFSSLTNFEIWQNSACFMN